MLRFLNYFLVSLILVCSNSFAQVNPDPQYHWIFDKSHSEGYQFVDQQGNLDARHLSKPSYLIEAGSEYLEFGQVLKPPGCINDWAGQPIRS